MTSQPRFALSTVVLGTPHPRTLAEFYRQLLGWGVGADSADWVTLRHPEWAMSLGFQLEVDHTPPVWPAGPGEQQMQLHLDVQVDDLDAATAAATALGARVAAYQPQPGVRVLQDPDGHPFCLWIE